MSLSFPTSPSNGATVTASNITWTYNATKGVWQNNVIGLSGASITIAADSGTNDVVTLGEDTLTVAGGTGLTSTVTNNQISLALDNTSVTANTYGGSGTIPQITVDAQGRITAVASIPTSNFQITTSYLSASSILNSTAYGIKVLGNTNWTALGATSVNVSSASLVVGREYIITSVGTTHLTNQWPVLGADADAAVGEIFKAKFAGAANYGTGTVLETMFTSTSSAATNAAATGTGKIALDTAHFITFVDGTSGTSNLLVSNQLKYNPGNGSLTADNLNGSFIGSFAGSFAGTLNAGVAIDATKVEVSRNDTASVPSGDKLFLTLVEDVTGPETVLTDTRIYYDDDTDTLVSNSFTGPLTGNVTGNVTGSAATVTTAAQTAITSVGTLTALQVDNININGSSITAAAGNDINISPPSGSSIVLDGTISIDAGLVTGATRITSTNFVGALTGNVDGDVTGNVTGNVVGNVTGNVSGSAGTTTGNAATATTLATARTIGGVSFDGSAPINLPGVNTAGNQSTSGNAATATTLATARTIGGVSFDGSAPINLPGVNAAGNQDHKRVMQLRLHDGTVLEQYL